VISVHVLQFSFEIRKFLMLNSITIEHKMVDDSLALHVMMVHNAKKQDILLFGHDFMNTTVRCIVTYWNY